MDKNIVEEYIQNTMEATEGLMDALIEARIELDSFGECRSDIDNALQWVGQIEKQLIELQDRYSLNDEDLDPFSL